MTDLSDLITPAKPTPPSQDVRFRQGVIVAWNQTTGENTVSVGGTQMTDLPILNSLETVLLQPGDVVGILVIGNSGAKSMVILGRLTPPGAAGAASALQALNRVGLVEASVAADVSTTSTTFTTLSGGPSVTATVTSSGRLWVNFGAEVFLSATSAAPALGGYITVSLSGANTVAASDDWNTGRYTQVGASTFLNDITGVSRSHLFTGLNAGATTITMQYLNFTGAATVTFRRRNITAIAL